jgi:hypothetical protein
MSTQIAELASEYWKLLKGFERSIASAPIEIKPRLQAQARYASGRLNSILERSGMRIVSFDGLIFEVNMPAIAINADDYDHSDNLVVETTLEPAVVSDMAVLLTGKVFVSKAPLSE